MANENTQTETQTPNTTAVINTELNGSAPPPGTPPGTQEPKAIYKTATTEFTDPNELAEYTKSLEEKVVQHQLQDATRQGMPSNQPLVVTPPPARKTLEEEVEECLFTDPKTAIAKLRQGIRAEFNEDANARKREDNFWETFYSENPDLKSLDRIVKSVVREKSEEIKPLTVGKAKEFLANESRKMIALVRGSTGITKQELPSGEGVVVASGGSHNTKSGETPRPTTTFVDELRTFQRRGKK